jgi:peptidoglycan/xylan/chitin deacetylase (PgdA/CDA1 family)
MTDTSEMCREGTVIDAALRLLTSLISPAGEKSRLSALIFHRVLHSRDELLDDPTIDEFETLMRWTRSQFNVVPLQDAIAGLRNGRLPARPLVITFDDGYADNADLAAPVLRQLGLPATFFIANGFLNGGRMFNDTVYAAVKSCRSAVLDLTTLGLGRYPLGSASQRRQACATLLPQLKELPIGAREQVTAEICSIARVIPPVNLMMTSSQVADLAAQGFEIGSHTVSHPILARIGEVEARREIQQNRQRLGEIVGKRPRFFAYPNGHPGKDYTLETARIVRELGFEAAFTTERGVARVGTDLFQLPRFTPWDRSRFGFGLRMAHNLWHVRNGLRENSNGVIGAAHSNTFGRNGRRAP